VLASRAQWPGLVITVDVRDEACEASANSSGHALNARTCDVIPAIRDLTGGNGADVVFECAWRSPKQGLAGHQTLLQALRWCARRETRGCLMVRRPLELNVDLLRERSLRYLFPDISTQVHLEHTVRWSASGRIHLKSTLNARLSGIESVPRAFEITANKGKYKAINPAKS